ncbi:MAG: hypothetical protein WC846_05135 [Candidatus Gracilibacteria bacterium]
MKKLIPSLITLLAISLLAGCVETETNEQVISSDKANEEQLASCIEGKSDYDPTTEGLVKGVIEVAFDAEYTEKDISNILNEYDLTIGEGPYSWESYTTITVSVPENTEIEWGCRLSQDERVRFASERLLNS